MQRGRIRYEEVYFAAIRQTLITINKDPKSPAPSTDDLRPYDLPDYDYDGQNQKPRPIEHRPFSELKAQFEAANPRRRLT